MLILKNEKGKAPQWFGKKSIKNFGRISVSKEQHLIKHLESMGGGTFRAK